MLNNSGTENQKPMGIEGRKGKLQSQGKDIEAKCDTVIVMMSFY